MFKCYALLFQKEFQKALTYRLDLWIGIIVAFPVEMLVQGCLWYSIFQASNRHEIGGWDLKGMIAYTILAFFVRRVVSSRNLDIATEVYTGGLNRFLTFPVNFIFAKYMGYWAYSSILFLQFGAGILIFTLVAGWPSAFPLDLGTIIPAMLSLILAQYLYYMVVALIDMAAFWIDATWSLLLMWRLTIMLLGGALFPLSFFPSAVQEVLLLLPIPYVYAWPLETLLGRLSFGDWLQGFTIGLVWAATFTALTHWAYQNGLKRYSGVGI